ncbi:MAG: hypothetical protein J6S23_02680 [Clostridia bacterium]|nr:hypothetical protein [Clostridia bacterium]
MKFFESLNPLLTENDVSCMLCQMLKKNPSFRCRFLEKRENELFVFDEGKTDLFILSLLLRNTESNRIEQEFTSLSVQDDKFVSYTIKFIDIISTDDTVFDSEELNRLYEIDLSITLSK